MGLAAMVFAVLCATEPPVMRPVITAGMTDTPPSIDGVMDDPCWAVAAVAGPFVLLGTAQFPSQRTVARICADNRAVYVGFWCWEDAVEDISTRAWRNDSGEAWRDDCVEVFLAPDGLGRVYYHVIVTAANIVDDEMCWRFGARRDMTWNCYPDTAVRRWRNGWTCEIAVPLRYLGGARPQGRWVANFARAEQPHGEFSAWAALVRGFHEPQRFGELNWAADAAVANIELSPLSVGPAWVKLGWATRCGQPILKIRQLMDGHQEELDVERGVERWRFTPIPRTRSFIRIEAWCPGAVGRRLVFATAPMAYSVPPVGDKLARLLGWLREASRIANRSDAPAAEQLRGRIAEARERVEAMAAEAGAIVHGQVVAAEEWTELDRQVEALRWPTFLLLAEARALERAGWARRPSLAIGWQSSLVKLRRDDTRVHLSGPIQLSAARDEWESAQLVLVPLGGDVDVADVDVGPLVSGSGARIEVGCVRVWRVGYVKTRKPIYPVDYVGWWPDPLMPLKPFTLRAGQIQPLWISVYVPPHTPAGDYSGRVKVKMADGSVLAWPLRLRVWDFRLPRPSRLRTAFSVLQRHDACLWYGWKGMMPKHFRMKFYRLMLEHRLNPMSLYTGEMFPPREDLKWCVEHGQNALNIRTVHFANYTKQETYQYIRGQAEWLREHGWLPLAFVYGFDEVKPEGHQAVRDAYGRIHREIPGLKTACTVVPCDDLVGYVDIWVPVTADFDPRKARERQKAGDEVWWYICCGPWHPYANWFIDYPATDARVLFWQTFKYGVQGFLYYEVAMWRTNLITKPNKRRTQLPPEEEWVRRAIAQGKRWPEIPWNTFTFARHNGDGLLIYPGPDETPLPSLRLEVVRDGIEDYDMLCVLRDAYEALMASEARREHRRLLAEAAALLSVRPTVARDLTHFTDDPRAIIREREAVARAILRIKRVLERERGK